MSFETSLETLMWTARLVAVVLILQDHEMLRLSHQMSSPKGVWGWKTVRHDFLRFPRDLQRLFDLLLGELGFNFLVGARMLVAFDLIADPSATLIWISLLTSILVSVRWRGSFNGGSDKMTLVLLTALAFGFSFRTNLHFIEMALGYIAVQACLSYFVAGLAKIRSPHWRSGVALKLFIENSSCKTPQVLKSVLKSPGRTQILAWAVVIFELGFPLALTNSSLCLVFLALSAAFHLANFAVFGLNRFFWIWLCTYPALYHSSLMLAGSGSR